MKQLGKVFAVLAAIMLFATSCSSADTSWAYRLGEDKVTAGLYINYMLDGYALAETKYTEAKALTSSEAEVSQPTDGSPALETQNVAPPPTSKELLKSDIEGTTAASFITEKAKLFSLEYYGINQKYLQLGLSQSEANTASALDNAQGLYKYASKFFDKNGISEESLQIYYKTTLKKQELFLKLYESGGEFEVPEQTLKETFSNSYARAEYMMFARPTAELVAEDGTVTSVEAQETEIKALAEAYLARFVNGEEIEQLIYDRMVEISPAGQEVTKPEKGTTALLVSEKDKAAYGKTLGNAIFGAEVGTPIFAQDDEFYYIIKRVDIFENPVDYAQYRASILSSLKMGEFEEKLQQWGAELNPEINQATINKYTTAIIDFDFKANE